MPDFVACPSCGCRIQMLLAMPGQRVRCATCGHRFEPGFPAANPTPTEQIPPLLDALPADDGPRAPRPEPKWPDADRFPPRQFNIPMPRLRRSVMDEDEEGLPFCPGCGRRVRWEAVACPYCEEEFEDDGDLRRLHRRKNRERRDDERPHRGALISKLGAASMVLGIFALCVGVTALAAIPLGMVAWSLANVDLEAMNDRRLDSSGRKDTLTGRANAVTGVIFGAVFGGSWLIFWLCLR